MYDVVTHDWAILIAREKAPTYRYTADGDNYVIWAWVMFWAPDPDNVRYTEESLFRMIEVGRLVLHKNAN